MNRRCFEWAIPNLFLRAAAGEDKAAQLVKTGVELFRSGDYAAARQSFKEALAKNPKEDARLFEILTRLAMKANPTSSALGEIDLALQKLLKAAKPEIAQLAKLSLGIVRFDFVAPPKAPGFRSQLGRAIPSSED